MRRTAAATVSIAITLALVACTSFSSPAGEDADAGTSEAAAQDAGCGVESCVDKPRCAAFDFTSCAEWDFGGDPSTTHACVDGKLKVTATDTLDAMADLSMKTPSSPYSLRIGARVAVNRWDGQRVFRVSLDGAPAIHLVAETTIGTSVEYKLCRAKLDDCLPKTLSFDAGTEHVFVFELAASAVNISVDCALFASEPGTTLPTSSTIAIAFGHPDGNPIDGTLDDLVIQYH